MHVCTTTNYNVGELWSLGHNCWEQSKTVIQNVNAITGGDNRDNSGLPGRLSAKGSGCWCDTSLNILRNRPCCRSRPTRTWTMQSIKKNTDVFFLKKHYPRYPWYVITWNFGGEIKTRNGGECEGESVGRWFGNQENAKVTRFDWHFCSFWAWFLNQIGGDVENVRIETDYPLEWRDLKPKLRFHKKGNEGMLPQLTESLFVCLGWTHRKKKNQNGGQKKRNLWRLDPVSVCLT